MNMTITALLLIVGTNILVGAIQLFVFVKTARANDELREVAAEYMKEITKMSMKYICESGVKVENSIDSMVAVFKELHEKNNGQG